MIGDDLLVTPVVEKGKTIRMAKLPKLPNGKWKADNGKIYKGGITVQLDVPIGRLPYFEVIK